MEEIARYGAEDVCSSLDFDRLRLMACRSPLAVPNRYLGANLPLVSAYPAFHHHVRKRMQRYVKWLQNS